MALHAEGRLRRTTPGVVNEDTPHYDLKLLYHDGKAQRPDKRLPFGSIRLPAAAQRASDAPISGRAWPFVMSFVVGLLMLKELRKWLVWSR